MKRGPLDTTLRHCDVGELKQNRTPGCHILTRELQQIIILAYAEMAWKTRVNWFKNPKNEHEFNFRSGWGLVVSIAHRTSWFDAWLTPEKDVNAAIEAFV